MLARGVVVERKGASLERGIRRTSKRRGESLLLPESGGDTGKTRRFVVPPPPSPFPRWKKFALLLNLHYLRCE